MLDSLSNALKNSIRKLIGAPLIDEKSVNEFIKDLQRALIKSDVNVKLVLEFTKNLKSRILEEKRKSISREFIVKTLYDELVKIIGKGEEIQINKRPYKIVLVGLFGSGKTTTAAKIAKFYSKRGLKVALLALDTFRPAAYQQLKQLGESIHTKVFGEEGEKNPIKIIKKFEEEFKKYDIIISDTSGRNALDKEMIEEIKNINKELKPDEELLVISADIGQGAKEQAEAFKQIGISGVIITKMDGSAKGGGALTACYIANVPIRFIGTGEKVGDIEKFDPKKFISRLIGLGDLETLLEKAKEEIGEEKAKNIEEKIMSGKFNLIDFYDQLEAMKKMGPLKKVISMIPGLSMANIPKEMLDIQQDKLKKFKIMMDSMTKYELENPEKINRSRIDRIAKGAGVDPSDVRELIKQFESMKKIIKKIKGKNIEKIMKRFKGKIPFSM